MIDIVLPSIEKIKLIKDDVIREYNYFLNVINKRIDKFNGVNKVYNDYDEFEELFSNEEGFKFLVNVFDVLDLDYKCKYCIIKSKCCNIESYNNFYANGKSNCGYGVIDSKDTWFVDFLYHDNFVNYNEVFKCNGVVDIIESEFIDFLYYDYYKKLNGLKSLIY
jgi:hypothetical protein